MNSYSFKFQVSSTLSQDGKAVMVYIIRMSFLADVHTQRIPFTFYLIPENIIEKFFEMGSHFVVQVDLELTM